MGAHVLVACMPPTVPYHQKVNEKRKNLMVVDLKQEESQLMVPFKQSDEYVLGWSKCEFIPIVGMS